VSDLLRIEFGQRVKVCGPLLVLFAKPYLIASDVFWIEKKRIVRGYYKLGGRAPSRRMEPFKNLLCQQRMEPRFEFVDDEDLVGPNRVK
jgi:hypothetical protein